MVIMDGKGLSAKIKDELKCEVESFDSIPCLSVITIGDDEASKIYVNNKRKACEHVGIGCIHLEYKKDVREEDIIKKIEELNNDKNVNGIIVQLPLPDGFNDRKIINSISLKKDVDGLTNESIGANVTNEDAFVACTPHGIMELLDYYKIDVSGKNAVVIGRSTLVGKPIMIELLKRNATCTICHTKTIDLKLITKNADVLVVATGHKYLIDKSMIKDDAVIIDVGISKEDSKIYGDVNPNVKDKCSFYTPVPGGVGPMTVASLLKNTIISYKKMNGLL